MQERLREGNTKRRILTLELYASATDEGRDSIEACHQRRKELEDGMKCLLEEG